MKVNPVIKLTTINGETVLIGTESIIRVRKEEGVTDIESRHAMVAHTKVIETVEQVYEKIYSK